MKLLIITKKKQFGIPVLWVKPENECRTLACVHKVICDSMEPGNISQSNKVTLKNIIQHINLQNSSPHQSKGLKFLTIRLTLPSVYNDTNTTSSLAQTANEQSNRSKKQYTSLLVSAST